MKKVILRKNMSVRVLTMNEEPSKTDQQWESDCNVNNIMKRFESTGQLTHTAKSPGVFADVSELGDFQAAMNAVTTAQNEFNELAPEIRERFNQSPVALVNFLSNPNNREEAIKLGLIPETPTEQVVTRTDGNPSAENKRKRVSPNPKISSSDQKSEELSGE